MRPTLGNRSSLIGGIRNRGDNRMTAGVSYPFPLIFERDSSLDEKRRYMENFAEQFIQKLA